MSELQKKKACLCCQLQLCVCFEAEVSGGVNAQPGAAPVSPCTSSPFIRRTCCGGRGRCGVGVRGLWNSCLTHCYISGPVLEPWSTQIWCVYDGLMIIRVCGYVSLPSDLGAQDNNEEPCGVDVSTNMSEILRGMHQVLIIAGVCVTCCRKHAAILKQMTLICFNDCLVEVLSDSVINTLLIGLMYVLSFLSVLVSTYRAVKLMDFDEKFFLCCLMMI